MGKTYLNTSTQELSLSRDITVTAPFDVRSVVDTESDLYNKDTFGNYTYVGMMVTVADTQDVFVLAYRPGKREDYATTVVWKKVNGSDGTATAVITTDGSVPSSNSGITISNDDKDAFVEEVYADSGLEAGKFYAGRGLNSTTSNGGDLDDDYIILTNGGTSYIKLYSSDEGYDNWIELSITDDSLGITKDQVKYVGEDGEVHTMEGDTIVLPKESAISFDVPFDLTGMTESRTDGSEYVFGQDGSGYDDIDFYTTNVLPTIYAYSDGTPVRVLTEGDKTEIYNIIEENANPESISESDIMELFGKTI